MQTLTDALERAVLPRVNRIQAEVDSVEKTGWGWCVDTPETRIGAENVILACPAHVSAQLVRHSCAALSDQLASIPYSSALLVTLVYDRDQLEHPLDGFGFLVPAKERRGVAAATWTSTKFPSRTPGNRAALRAFIVGDDALELMPREEKDLIDLVRKEYLRLMGIAAEPLFSTIYRWPNSMPQYTVGHQVRRNAIARLSAAELGLYLCGNFYDGVGIPDCIRTAEEVQRRILSFGRVSPARDVKEIS
jgi:oxygen-dependent protoporphyrinogen oxidase